MRLEQVFPQLYGNKHGFVEKVDMAEFRRGLRRLDPMSRYFRVTLEGAENIPEQGGALLVGNHGPFGMDAPFLIKEIYDHRHRFVRALADRVIFQTPFYRLGPASFGVLEGEPEQAVRLLQKDKLVLVYPGGAKETARSPKEKYQLRWDGHYGFIRVALRAQKPIIPVACIGIDDLFFQPVTQEQMLKTPLGKYIAEKYGNEKYAMPVYMGLGPLPIPRKLTYHVGWPIHLGYGPEAANDREVVAKCHTLVKAETEKLIAYGLRTRELRQKQLRRLLARRADRFLSAAAETVQSVMAA